MKIKLMLIFVCIVCTSYAQVNWQSEKVKTYKKKNGTIVKPYKRTKPNRTEVDNYSTAGNINPYTLKKENKKVKK